MLVENPPVDKSSWGPGPWQEEPDRVEFKHAGLPCLLLRNRVGAWCGYAAVSPGHPLYGKPYDEAADIEVHGGLTYSDKCQGEICHIPAPGEPDDMWWFGFACAHTWDFAPQREASLAIIPKIVELRATRPAEMPREIYRDLPYVRAQTESLAEQLAQFHVASTHFR